jgi:hypothetical protein
MKCSNRVFENGFVDLPGIAEKALSELCLTIRKTRNIIIGCNNKKISCSKKNCPNKTLRQFYSGTKNSFQFV